MCRIQNSSLVSDSHAEFPLADLTAIYQPRKTFLPLPNSNEFTLDGERRLELGQITDGGDEEKDAAKDQKEVAPAAETEKEGEAKSDLVYSVRMQN